MPNGRSGHTEKGHAKLDESVHERVSHMKKFVFTILTILFLAGAAALVLNYYPYLFSKDVSGTVLRVERLNHCSKTNC